MKPMQKLRHFLAAVFIASAALTTPALAEPVTAALTGLLLPAFGSFASGIAGIITYTGLSVAASLAGQLFAKQPKVVSSGIQTQQTTTGEVTPYKFILGTYATEGHAIAPPYTHGTLNAWMTYILEVSNVPVEGLTSGRVAVNAKYYTIDTAPENEDPQYGYPLTGLDVLGAPHAWIKFYDGTQTTADPYLVNEYSSHPTRPWTLNHINEGSAYAIVTFRYNPEVFQSRPSVRFELDGIRLYDPRKDSSVGGSGSHRWANTNTWEFTTNPLVMAYNICRGITLPTGDVYGGEYQAEDLPLDNWFAAMNACDVLIGSRKTYEAGFEVDVSVEPSEILNQLFRASFTQFSCAAGVARVRTGAPAIATVSFTDDDLILTKPGSADPFPRIEAVRNTYFGTYVEPEDIYQGREVTPYSDPEWLARDNGAQLAQELPMPAVFNKSQAQHLLESYAKDDNRFRAHVVTLPPDYSNLQVFDTVLWNSAEYGYTSKTFEITGRFVHPVTHLPTFTIRERDAGDVAWTPGQDLPPEVSKLGTSPPADITMSSLQATPTTIPDAAGGPTGPGIELTWSSESEAPLADVARFRMRIQGTTKITENFPADAETNRVTIRGLRNTAYEVQGRYVLQGRKPVWPDTWVQVTTPDIGLAASQIDDTVANDIAAAQTLAQQGVDDAATVQANLDTEISNIQVDYQAAVDAAADAVAARTGAEAAELGAQTAQTGSEAARDITETARDVTLAAQVITEAARDETLVAETNALDSANAASVFATSANSDAGNASQSAESAQLESLRAAVAARNPQNLIFDGGFTLEESEFFYWAAEGAQSRTRIDDPGSTAPYTTAVQYIHPANDFVTGLLLSSENPNLPDGVTLQVGEGTYRFDVSMWVHVATGDGVFSGFEIDMTLRDVGTVNSNLVTINGTLMPMTTRGAWQFIETEQSLTVPAGKELYTLRIFSRFSTAATSDTEIRWTDLQFEDVTQSYNAGQSALAAADEASLAETFSGAAGLSANAASADRLLAEAAKDDAENFASASSDSADQAAVHVTDAGNFATVAEGHSLDAATEAGNALAASGSSADSAADALGYRNEAETFRNTVASTSAEFAQDVAAQGTSRIFGVEQWTWEPTSATNIGSKGQIFPVNLVTNDPDFGNCYTGGPNTNAHFGPITPLPYDLTRVYSVKFAAKVVVDNGATFDFRAGATLYEAGVRDATAVNIQWEGPELSVASGPQVYEVWFSHRSDVSAILPGDVDAFMSLTAATSPTNNQFMPHVRVMSVNAGGSAEGYVGYLEVRDVTALANALIAESAADGSATASTAAKEAAEAAETNAGNFATVSADESAVATVKAAEAAGHAGAAATSATLADSRATDAENASLASETKRLQATAAFLAASKRNLIFDGGFTLEGSELFYWAAEGAQSRTRIDDPSSTAPYTTAVQYIHPANDALAGLLLSSENPNLPDGVGLQVGEGTYRFRIAMWVHVASGDGAFSGFEIDMTLRDVGTVNSNLVTENGIGMPVTTRGAWQLIETEQSLTVPAGRELYTLRIYSRFSTAATSDTEIRWTGLEFQDVTQVHDATTQALAASDSKDITIANASQTSSDALVAQTERLLTEAARDDAEDSATASSDSANLASTKATEAGNSATAADDARLLAVAAKDGSENAATASASSATLADSKATEAANSATAADTARVQAETAQGAAEADRILAVQAASDADASKVAAQSAETTAVSIITDVNLSQVDFQRILEDASDFEDTSGTLNTLTTLTGELGQTSVVVLGTGAGTLNASGNGNGHSIQIPPEQAQQFAGNRVRVDILTRRLGSNPPASNFAIAYTTQDAGNSGIQNLSSTGTWSWKTFYYDVPFSDTGTSDWIVLWGDADGGGGQTVFGRVVVRKVTDAADVPEIGITDASVSLLQTAVADLEGNASASLVWRVKAGTSGAEIELVALDNASGAAESVYRVAADTLIFDSSLSAFGGAIASDNFNGTINSSGVITNVGTTGYALDQTGQIVGTNIIDRALLAPGAVADRKQDRRTGAFSPTNVSTWEVVASITLGAISYDEHWQVQASCLLRYISNPATYGEMRLQQSVWVPGASGYGDWDTVATQTIGASFTDWFLRTATTQLGTELTNARFRMQVSKVGSPAAGNVHRNASLTAFKIYDPG